MVIKLAVCVLAALAAFTALFAYLLLVHWAVASSGQYGWTFGIQPPHIAAGFGIVRNHVISWWEVQ